MIEIPLRLGLQQRVLPTYRVPFFEALAAACSGGLSIFAGQPRSSEAIDTAISLKGITHYKARDLHLFSGRAYLCLQTGLLTWLDSWQPQALIVEANPRYLNTPRAVRWMHSRNRPVIGWGLGAPRVSSNLRALSRRRFLSTFDAVIAYSEQGAREYAAAGIDPQRIFVAPNAVTGRPSAPPPVRPDNKPAGRMNVLFVGRLQERKRVDLLIRACAGLPEQLQPALSVVGDGPERYTLEELATREYPRTKFLGAIHGTDLAPLYKDADIFILPGTGGLAVQQAMSYALPVIVAEADGTQADLVRPDNGWVVPSGDLNALTTVMTNALSDLSRLRRMGTASYRVVDEEINIENMVAVFASAIQKSLSGNTQNQNSRGS
jgi:glycosyltransferase involved in cell wall biosynthesis